MKRNDSKYVGDCNRPGREDEEEVTKPGASAMMGVEVGFQFHQFLLNFTCCFFFPPNLLKSIWHTANNSRTWKGKGRL